MTEAYHIYLAGGYDSEWRCELATRWAGRPVSLHDPFLHSRQRGIYAFTEDDLRAVERADLVFGFVDYARYTGTALEFGYAHAHRKPIIFATTLPRIDSMMAGVADAVFTSLDAAAEYAERRYLPRRETT